MGISQVRKVYEAVESVLTSDLKEHGVFRPPGLATFSARNCRLVQIVKNMCVVDLSRCLREAPSIR